MSVSELTSSELLSLLQWRGGGTFQSNERRWEKTRWEAAWMSCQRVATALERQLEGFLTWPVPHRAGSPRKSGVGPRAREGSRGRGPVQVLLPAPTPALLLSCSNPGNRQVRSPTAAVKACLLPPLQLDSGGLCKVVCLFGQRQAKLFFADICRHCNPTTTYSYLSFKTGSDL